MFTTKQELILVQLWSHEDNIDLAKQTNKKFTYIYTSKYIHIKPLKKKTIILNCTTHIQNIHSNKTKIIYTNIEENSTNIIKNTILISKTWETILNSKFSTYLLNSRFLTQKQYS